jgi:hypothetical protein
MVKVSLLLYLYHCFERNEVPIGKPTSTAFIFRRSFERIAATMLLFSKFLLS